MIENLVIYTDGSCWNKDRIGGWAAVALTEHEIDGSVELGVSKLISGSATDTSIGRMEMRAVIEALRLSLEYATRGVIIFCDSEYVVLGNTTYLPTWLKSGWKKSDRKDVKNKDLWLEMVEMRKAVVKKHGSKAIFTHVKGHSKNKWNDLVDETAGQARRAQQIVSGLDDNTQPADALEF